MTPNARCATAAALLDDILAGDPAERALTTWARRNRYAGSGDRAAIRDLVFDALRRKRSLAWLGGGATGRGLMLGYLRAEGMRPEEVFSGGTYDLSPLSEAELAAGAPLSEAPQAVAWDVPDWLVPSLITSLGDTTPDVMAMLQSRAPVFLRVNLARSTREDARKSLANQGIATTSHGLSPSALIVTENPRRVAQSEAYLSGLVELQDAASQAVVDAVADRVRGARVLDYCAGGGGKSLALAMHGPSQIVAYDAAPERMKDLPKRAERAGVSIDVAVNPTGQFDVVFCDAPCSGSGAWRRQPEGKWRLTPERLAELTDVQDEVLVSAMAHVAPSGVLAYATCSLLDAENSERVTTFLERFPNWTCLNSTRLTLLDGGDGFFVAILTQG